MNSRVVITPQDISGVVPGVRGQRAFPTRSLRNADPFLMLDHIGPERIAPHRVLEGVAHPHRGFETVSIWLAGTMNHVDSLGNKKTVGAGDVQVMHAGSGILHGGDMLPDAKTGEFHEFQLWVNVPSARKMDPPSVQDVRAQDLPVLTGEGRRLRVLTGEYSGRRSPAQTVAQVTILHGKLEGNRTEVVELVPRTQRAIVYVVGGSLRVDGTVLGQFEAVDLGIVDRAIDLSPDSDGAEYLFLSGHPLNEPVVFGGPFVMTNQEEIEQAFEDYEAGKFGDVPH